MCLSLAFVCSEVDGIVVIYLWPPSFAYSKILTRGRYLSRHSRCLRGARVSRGPRPRDRARPHAAAAMPSKTKCGRRQAPLEVHEQPLPVLHLLDQPAVAEPADLISVLALGVLLGAPPARALEPIGVLDLDVPSLGAAHADGFAGGHLVPARDALLRALLSASPMVLSLDSDKQSARRLPPSRRADRNDQQPAPRGAAVPRKTKADAAKRCCASSFVSPLDSVVGSLVVRGGQRPNRFASRLGASRGRPGSSGAWVESGRGSSTRLGSCLRSWLPFCASPNVFARSHQGRH